ncbi:MAG TPA: hypothetical protein VG105_19980, partial [Paraburkholderia sp.]|nr:hypothetical protein [Paraburkholderia sp.]
MASKFIKFAEMPANFDVTKYAVCEDWDLGLWASNLAQRTVRKDCIQGAIESGDDKYLAMLREFCSSSFDDPVLNYSIEQEGPLGMNGEPWSATAQRVRDLNCLEYLRAHELFSEDAFARYTLDYQHLEYPFSPHPPIEPGHARDAHERLVATPEWQMWKECATVAEPAFSFSPFALASVDLNADDGELINDFRQWLSQARATRGIVPATEEFSAEKM